MPVTYLTPKGSRGAMREGIGFSMSDQPPTRGQKMDKVIADKMAKIFFGMLEGEFPDDQEDMRFFTNHLSSFTAMMADQAVEALVYKYDVDEDFANLVVRGTAMLNKMNGANSFNDYCATEEMAQAMREAE
jgi:hypothetical protein